MRLHGDIEGGAPQDFLIGEDIKDCLAQPDDGKGAGQLELMHRGAAVHVEDRKSVV